RRRRWSRGTAVRPGATAVAWIPSLYASGVVRFIKASHEVVACPPSPRSLPDTDACAGQDAAPPGPRGDPGRILLGRVPRSAGADLGDPRKPIANRRSSR